MALLSVYRFDGSNFVRLANLQEGLANYGTHVVLIGDIVFMTNSRSQYLQTYSISTGNHNSTYENFFFE